MNYLPEETLSEIPLSRLNDIRRDVLEQIYTKSGSYCCDLKCEWYANENYTPTERDADYAYHDLVNKYYDHRTEELMRVVKKSCMGIPTLRGTKECLRIQEPVAWQFYDEGGWYNGSNHYKHRKNTIEAGYRTRDLYPVQSSASIIVPDEMKEHQAAYQGCPHSLSTAFMEGANWMREEVLRLNSGKLVLCSD